MPQLIRVAAIGPKVCGYCEEFIKELADMGLYAEKLVFDPDLHDEFLQKAKSEGLTEMPLVCTIEDDDTLVYVSAGRAPFVRTKLAVMEKRLQAAVVTV